MAATINRAFAEGRITESQAQRASWAFGNCAIANSDVTEEMAIKAVLDIDQKDPEGARQRERSYHRSKKMARDILHKLLTEGAL